MEVTSGCAQSCVESVLAPNNNCSRSDVGGCACPPGMRWSDQECVENYMCGCTTQFGYLPVSMMQWERSGCSLVVQKHDLGAVNGEFE